MRKVVFRADGNTQIGLGHVIRSMALYNMLSADFDCSFASRSNLTTVLNNVGNIHFEQIPESINLLDEAEYLTANKIVSNGDVMVLDGYNFETNYQQSFKDKNLSVVCIDDIHSYHFVADLVINHAYGVNENAYSKEKCTKLLLGLDYALLRPSFLELSKKTRAINKVSSVLINMGGADEQNVTSKILKACLRVKGIERINVMIGAANPNKSSIEKLVSENKGRINLVQNLSAEEVCQLMLNSEIVICPASSICVEAAAVGMGICAGYTANNQLNILHGFESNKALLNLGNLIELSEEDALEKIASYINNLPLINQHISVQKQLIDGKSDERLKKEIAQLLEKHQASWN